MRLTLYMCFFVIFVISCSKSEIKSDSFENGNDSSVENNDIESTTDTDIDEEECVFWAEFYSNGAGNSECPFNDNYERTKRGFSTVSGSLEGTTFVVEEILNLEERKEVVLKGPGCENDQYKLDSCMIVFKNHDYYDLFKNLLNKEIVVYWVEGFYGDVYGDYIDRDVQVVRHKNGDLIAASGVGIVNEDGDNEHEWDKKVWPSELLPEIKAEQKIPENCAYFCAKFESGGTSVPGGAPEKWEYDILIAPPVEITVNGKSPVLVRNGEVIKSEGYEYFVRNSLRAHEKDPDGKVLIYGKEYKFDFFVLNVGALK